MAGNFIRALSSTPVTGEVTAQLRTPATESEIKSAGHWEDGWLTYFKEHLVNS